MVLNPKAWPFDWKLLSSPFPVVLFIILHNVVLTFESAYEIPKCDHSNESYWAVLSCGAVYYAVQGTSNFWACGWHPKVWPFTCMEATEQYFSVVLFIMLFKVVLAFESVDEIPKCNHSNESYWGELFSKIFFILFTWTDIADIVGRLNEIRFSNSKLECVIWVVLQCNGDNDNTQWISKMAFSSLHVFGCLIL